MFKLIVQQFTLRILFGVIGYGFLERVSPETRHSVSSKPLVAALLLARIKSSTLGRGLHGKLLRKVCRHDTAKCMSINREVPQALGDAGRLAAEWCVKQGYGQAAVSVSSAASTPAAMRDFWATIRTVGLERGSSSRHLVLALPMWTEAARDDAEPAFVLETAMQFAEVCEYFNKTVFVENIRTPNVPCAMFLFTSEASEANGVSTGPSASRSPDEKQVVAESRSWVDGIIVNLHACPYASSADTAGGGGVAYPVSHATNAEGVLESYWREFLRLYVSSEKDVATTLLLTPYFAVDAVDIFSKLCLGIKQTLNEFGMTPFTHIASFHPSFEYTSTDLPADLLFAMEDMPAPDDVMHYSRRSPYPIINLLRTEQLARKTSKLDYRKFASLVYVTNNENCDTVGKHALQQMLTSRDWRGLDDLQFTKHVFPEASES